MSSLSLLRLAAFGLLALAGLGAAIEVSRRSADEPAIPAAEIDHDALLARCRGLAPEDYATAEDCRAAWEAERRRFFGAPDREEEASHEADGETPPDPSSADRPPERE